MSACVCTWQRTSSAHSVWFRVQEPSQLFGSATSTHTGMEMEGASSRSHGGHHLGHSGGCDTRIGGNLPLLELGRLVP